ncbi:cytochrome P450 [Actinocorallia sp. API 0066]|uniref:cytochrome P450 n=1 Tax=Actinocorallia sp. API 0066 TaxID=2896846 RepID=UPI001E39B759|nr:cytochrome P450 [Actinocorallia sp. API 0066]MCD0448209.1 cytochrome P450 [Actinocorallia sp. API 0066]
MDRHEARLLRRGNPWLYTLLRGARLAGPLTRAPRLGWLVTDPVLARAVLRDGASFTMAGEGGVGHLWGQLFGPEMAALFDGAGHTRVRTAARDLFTGDAASALVERTQGDSYRDVAARLREGETVDVAARARVLAGRLVADLLGLRLGPNDAPYENLFSLGERLAGLALGTAASTDLPEAKVRTAERIAAELTRAVPEAYTTAPDDTILGRCRALGLGLDLTRGLATLLAVAGTETGVSGTTRTVALLHDTGQQRALLADPALMENAVREGLRVATPAPVIGRHVARDVTVEGRRIKQGDRVVVLTHRANNGVGAFDVTRDYVPETRQLWFGAGRHLCLGASVARLQVTRMLESLTAEGLPYAVVSRQAARKVLVPTYHSLKVRLDGAN